ncbi:recombinase family protein [Actinopolymorpha pittospori]
MILVNIDANTSPSVSGGVALYARVCSLEQRSDLGRQTARLSAWAGKAGHKVARIESEIASGMNRCRWKAQRLLADPKVSSVVVEHKHRLGRMNVELIEARPPETLSAAHVRYPYRQAQGPARQHGCCPGPLDRGRRSGVHLDVGRGALAQAVDQQQAKDVPTRCRWYRDRATRPRAPGPATGGTAPRRPERSSWASDRPGRTRHTRT